MQGVVILVVLTAVLLGSSIVMNLGLLVAPGVAQVLAIGTGLTLAVATVALLMSLSVSFAVEYLCRVTRPLAVWASLDRLPRWAGWGSVVGLLASVVIPALHLGGVRFFSLTATGEDVVEMLDIEFVLTAAAIGSLFGLVAGVMIAPARIQTGHFALLREALVHPTIFVGILWCNAQFWASPAVLAGRIADEVAEGLHARDRADALKPPTELSHAESLALASDWRTALVHINEYQSSVFLDATELTGLATFVAFLSIVVRLHRELAPTWEALQERAGATAQRDNRES